MYSQQTMKQGPPSADTAESKPEPQTSPLPASSDHASFTSQHDNDNDNKSTTARLRFAKFWRFYDAVSYTPKRCRWDPVEPPRFNIWLNLLFGAAGAFTVANLYYSHPILGILAEDFGVDYVAVAEIPTLAQAGYAIGLLTLCPLGDLLKRRPFVLYLVFLTATLS